MRGEIPIEPEMHKRQPCENHVESAQLHSVCVFGFFLPSVFFFFFFSVCRSLATQSDAASRGIDSVAPTHSKQTCLELFAKRAAELARVDFIFFFFAFAFTAGPAFQGRWKNSCFAESLRGCRGRWRLIENNQIPVSSDVRSSSQRPQVIFEVVFFCLFFGGFFFFYD